MVTRARRTGAPSKSLVATELPHAPHAEAAAVALDISLEHVDAPWDGVLTLRDPAITGAKGENRNLKCKRRWANDYEALRAYFKESVGANPNTVRRYAAELGKVVLWAALVRKRAVSSLEAEDLQAFMRFLMFPPADWVGPRLRTILKGGPGWRPLARAASDDNVAGVLNVLQGFYSFLLVNKYILDNPLESFRRLRVAIEGERKDAEREHRGHGRRGGLCPVGPADSSGPKAGVPRVLDRVHLVALFAGLTALPGPMPSDRDAPDYAARLRVRQLLADRDHNERAWFLLHVLLYGTPRVTELARSRMNSVVLEGGLWWWNIHGKGNKLRREPVVPELLAALTRYRKHFGYLGDPAPHEDTPLLFSLRDTSRPAITPKAINLILDDIGLAAVAAVDQAPGLDARYRELLKGPLLAQSAHWWRHAGATRQAVAGVPDWALQHNLGHSSIEIARQYYLEDQERERHAATSKVRLLPEHADLGTRDAGDIISTAAKS